MNSRSKTAPFVSCTSTISQPSECQSHPVSEPAEPIWQGGGPDAHCALLHDRLGFFIYVPVRPLAGPRSFGLPRACRARAPRPTPTGACVEMTLAYVYTLSCGQQGFRPFGPHHREAAGQVGSPAASSHVPSDHQTALSRALATAPIAVKAVVDSCHVLLLGNMEGGQTTYTG